MSYVTEFLLVSSEYEVHMEKITKKTKSEQKSKQKETECWLPFGICQSKFNFPPFIHM